MRLTIVSKFYRDIPEFIKDVLISWMKSQARNVGYVFCYESGLKIEFYHGICYEHKVVFGE